MVHQFFQPNVEALANWLHNQRSWWLNIKLFTHEASMIQLILHDPLTRWSLALFTILLSFFFFLLANFVVAKMHSYIYVYKFIFILICLVDFFDLATFYLDLPSIAIRKQMTQSFFINCNWVFSSPLWLFFFWKMAHYLVIA
jgi:hypothetical protein